MNRLLQNSRPRSPLSGNFRRNLPRSSSNRMAREEMEPNPRMESVNRILIIRLAMIGDVLLTTPVASTLRNSFLGAHITYLTSMASAKEILLSNPDIDEIMISGEDSIPKFAKREKYDLVIDLFGNNFTKAICLACGARYRIGLSGRELEKNFVIPFYNVKNNVPISKKQNVIEHFLNTTRSLGLKENTKKTKLLLTEEEKIFALRFLQKYNIGSKDRIIGIQPGSNAKQALWEKKKFILLITELAKDFDAHLIIFPGPDDRTSIAKEIYDETKDKAILIPVLPIRKYASILSKCGVLITSKGGPMHIAAALGIKTIAIFTNPEKYYWFPYRKKEGFISFDHFAHKKVSVKEVLQAVEKLLLEKEKKALG